MLMIVGVNNLNVLLGTFYVKIHDLAYKMLLDPPHVVSANIANTLY